MRSSSGTLPREPACGRETRILKPAALRATLRGKAGLLQGDQGVILGCCSPKRTCGPRAGAAGVSLAVAAGPFTCAEDCAYAPLDALLAWAGGARPDVLLLLGPFVDAEHPAVAGGLLEESFEELFAAQVGHWGMG